MYVHIFASHFELQLKLKFIQINIHCVIIYIFNIMLSKYIYISLTAKILCHQRLT